MKEIDIAKKLLNDENLNLAIVKDSKIIFKSTDRGIKPLYTAINEIREKLSGCSIADRVTGKAAAMLCKHGDIKELHTKLISENAINILKETSIIFNYDELTPFIKNRDKTGMCPIESLSIKANSIDELLAEISSFLENIGKMQNER
jgi:L-lactate utilization protein LutC